MDADDFNILDNIEGNIEDIEVLEDIEDLKDIEDIEDIENNPGPSRRYIRDFLNPFEFYDDNQFKRRFRFSKNVVMNRIVPLIIQRVEKPNKRGLPIAPEIQLLIGLRFYATGCFQTVCGNLVFVAQSSVSRCVTRISFLLASLMGKVIRMPSSPDKMQENRALFERLGETRNVRGIPGMDGAIDCTHIRLFHNKFQDIQEIYRNRKGYFSLNVQAVAGPRMEILDLVPEWPGSEHDSRILQNSRIFMRYGHGELNGLLLGDGGYSSYPFLITPFHNPGTRAEKRYNYVHSRTRMVVERMFGIWKRRFPCLTKGLGNKLVTTTAIIAACAVLHNIALRYDNDLPEDEEGYEEPPTNQMTTNLQFPVSEDKQRGLLFVRI